MTWALTAVRSPGVRSHLAIAALGCVQILKWGGSYYLPAVLGKHIVAATGWSYAIVIGGLSLGLAISGLSSIFIGRRIEHHGGRPVLLFATIVLAFGEVLLGMAPNPLAYFAAWAVLGIGMGAGLYDAAFATLGRLYGQRARQAISTLTLWSGFASTVTWPLSAFLVERFGWRGTCFTYACLELLLCLPLILAFIPARAEDVALPEIAADNPLFAEPRPLDRPRATFLVLASILTVAATSAAVMSVHMLAFFEAGGLSEAEAVAVGTLLGPAQVFTRLIERFIGNRLHPIWILLIALLFMTLGLSFMSMGAGVAVIAVISYGAGAGIWSIARGTLPLALFGSKGYAVLMGRLAMPMLVAQAIAPSIGAILIDRFGASATIAMLAGTMTLSFVGILGLRFLARSAIVA
jgi:predicted MFS family arabinose efflux permease